MQFGIGEPTEDVSPFTNTENDVDFRAISPMSDNTGVAPVTQGQSERVNKDGFAGAGFAAQDGKAGVQLHIQGLDNGEVADLNRRKHDALAYTNGHKSLTPEAAGCTL